MIAIVSAVERRQLDALGEGGFRELLSDDLGALQIAAVFDAGILAAARGGAERDAFDVVDQLGVDVLGAAEDGQARAFRGADDLAAHMAAPPKLAPFLGFLQVHDVLDLPFAAPQDLRSRERHAITRRW